MNYNTLLHDTPTLPLLYSSILSELLPEINLCGTCKGFHRGTNCPSIKRKQLEYNTHTTSDIPSEMDTNITDDTITVQSSSKPTSK